MNQRRSFLNSQASQPSVSNDAVNQCVRYILYREGSKLPIPVADIKKHIQNTCEITKNELSNVIAAAANVLKKVYGYNLVKDDSKGNQYIVTLVEPCESPLSTLTNTEEQLLLNVALAHILMSGGSVKEDDMWNFLIGAGLMDDDNSSTIKQIFTKKFVQQFYITCTKSGADDLAKSLFEWGPRASKETTKMFMLQKVAQAFNKTPEFWREQYNIASSETTVSPRV